MTTAQVKGSNSFPVPGSANNMPSPKTSMDDLSFQSVFNSQTRDSGGSFKQVEKNSPSSQPAKRDSLQAKDKLSSNVDKTGLKSEKRSAEDVEKENEDVVSGEQGIEEIMAVLVTSVTELVEKIADTFRISAEEVEQLMTELNLTGTDLLEETNLSNLILAASGAQDSLSLLTDEGLYQNYRMLLEDGKKLTERFSDLLELPPQDLQDTLQQFTQLQEMQGREENLADYGQQEPVSMGDGENGFGELPTTVAEKTPVITTDDAQPQKEGSKDSGQNTPSENSLFAENLLRTTQSEMTESTRSTYSAADVDVQDVMNQILDYMKVQLKPETSDVEMQLHPASLGTLQIHVAAKEGVLSAHFITQNDAVKAALESQMIQLKDQFEQQGVKVEVIEVTVQTHQFEQNLEQGRERQPEQTTEGRRTRVRKISLDQDAEGLPENLDEEDRLVAEMMASNGTTVDFTA